MVFGDESFPFFIYAFKDSLYFFETFIFYYAIVSKGLVDERLELNAFFKVKEGGTGREYVGRARYDVVGEVAVLGSCKYYCGEGFFGPFRGAVEYKVDAFEESCRSGIETNQRTWRDWKT